MTLALQRVPGRYAVCRLAPDAPVPGWANTGVLQSITRTPDELTVVCDPVGVPPDVRADRDLSALRVAGTLDLSITGVLAALAAPLATAGVPIFVISSFDTDWILVRTVHVERAVQALTDAGFPVHG